MNRKVLILGAGSVAAVVATMLLTRSNSAQAAELPAPVTAGGSANPPNYPLVSSNVLGTISEGVLDLVGQPRGIRNNNPLNIRWVAANKWVGQTGADSGGFVVFDTAVNGVRAAAKVLRSYSNIGVKTIRQIITRWTSGDSSAVQSNYINYVAGQLNIGPDVVLSTNNWAALLNAMTYFENGKNPYQFNLFVQGVASAGV